MAAKNEMRRRMKDRRQILARGSCALLAATAGLRASRFAIAAEDKVVHSDADWQRLLTADQYAVLRQAETERPFTSPLLHETRNGVFSCAGCDLRNFSSKTKFDSGTGWPSFWAPIDGSVNTIADKSFGMIRTAVSCRRCDGHLGHVFDDGPKPTGLRYCMNGLALKFSPTAA
jgi:peptide-methionine (R)-S-oxide reductase